MDQAIRLIEILTKMDSPAAFAIGLIAAGIAVPITVMVINRAMTKRLRIEQEGRALVLGGKGTAITLKREEYE